jgi:Arc/MetJ-type ribon-helix-helix transcriptional regulator
MGGRPLGGGFSLDVHIDDEIVELVDRWLARHQGTILSRPDVVRHAVRQWLSEEEISQPDAREGAPDVECADRHG